MAKFWKTTFILVFLCFPVFTFAAPDPVQQGLIITIEIPGSPTPTPTPTASPTPTVTPTPTSIPGDQGGGGGGGIIPQGGTATVIFKGKAYPLAVITVLQDGVVAGTFSADSTGYFTKTLTGLAGRIYSFGFWAEDTEGRKSVTISFSISVIANAITTVDGIFISPTISLTPTQVEKGSTVDIAGQVFPESEVNIFIASNEVVKQASANSRGVWNYKFDTAAVEEGEHVARAKALFGEGEQSPFSQTIPFLVLEKGSLVCKGADFNFDGKVNLIDFSIMMYWWMSRNPGNLCVDINRDGMVNIVDFSILMYWWTS